MYPNLQNGLGKSVACPPNLLTPLMPGTAIDPVMLPVLVINESLNETITVSMKRIHLLDAFPFGKR